jgi:hypothetical protein
MGGKLRTWPGDATALDGDGVSVQVLVGLLEANEGLQKADGGVHVEIVFLANEPSVGNGLDPEHEIAGLVIGVLVRLTLEVLC